MTDIIAVTKDHLTIPKQVANSDTPDVNDTDVNQDPNGTKYPGEEWLLDEDQDEQEPRKDILKIVSDTLKEAKKLKSTCTIKIATQLTTVAEYVKLHVKYRAHLKCTNPCTNASYAIASWRGKGSYFARQICENECYLLCHHHLPPTTKGANTLCWTTVMSSKRFKFISWLRNLG